MTGGVKALDLTVILEVFTESSDSLFLARIILLNSARTIFHNLSEHKLLRIHILVISFPFWWKLLIV